MINKKKKFTFNNKEFKMNRKIIILAYLALITILVTSVGFWLAYNFLDNLNPFMARVSSNPAIFYLYPLIVTTPIFYLLIRKKTFLLLIPILLFSLNLGIQLNLTRQPRSSEHNLSIYSLNSAYYFAGYQTLNQMNHITDQNYDIILLQEIWRASQWERMYKPFLDKYFPDYNRVQIGEYVTLSKYPIQYTYLDQTEGFLRTDIKVKEQIISIYNIHIWSPLRPRPNFAFDVASPENFTTENLTPYNLRTNQFSNLQSNLQTNTNPVIVAGDFNALSHQNFIKEFKKSLNQARFNKTISWPRSFQRDGWLIILIDYIFYTANSHIELFDYQIDCDHQLSDHCGQQARFLIK